MSKRQQVQTENRARVLATMTKYEMVQCLLNRKGISANTRHFITDRCMTGLGPQHLSFKTGVEIVQSVRRESFDEPIHMARVNYKVTHNGMVHFFCFYNGWTRGMLIDYPSPARYVILRSFPQKDRHYVFVRHYMRPLGNIDARTSLLIQEKKAGRRLKDPPRLLLDDSLREPNPEIPFREIGTEMRFDAPDVLNNQNTLSSKPARLFIRMHLDFSDPNAKLYLTDLEDIYTRWREIHYSLRHKAVNGFELIDDELREIQFLLLDMNFTAENNDYYVGLKYSPLPIQGNVFNRVLDLFKIQFQRNEQMSQEGIFPTAPFHYLSVYEFVNARVAKYSHLHAYMQTFDRVNE